MTPPRNNPGFTLVELLVALLVTVLLVGSATALLRSVARGREVMENRVYGGQEAMAALRTITSTLRNAYRPVTDNDALLEGTLERSEPFPAARIHFRAVDRRIIRAGEPESDVHDIEFFMRDDGQRPLLMRRTDPTRNLPPDGGGVVEPLATNVVGLYLHYLDGGKWLDSWPRTQKGWPTAINVSLIYRTDTASGRVATVSRLVNFPYRSEGASQ